MFIPGFIFSLERGQAPLPDLFLSKFSYFYLVPPSSNMEPNKSGRGACPRCRDLSRFCNNACVDFEQLIDAMRAGVSLPDRSEAVDRQFFSKFRFAQHLLNELSHLDAVMRDQKILAGREQVFCVVPLRADERNASS